MKALTWLSGRAPDEAVDAGWPLSKAMTAGMDWMPSWPAISGMLVDVHLGQLHGALGGLRTDLLDASG
jgi:hypothetical protein